jgi:hypothetical protein
MENNLRKKYNFTGPTTEEYTGRTPGEHTGRTPSISLYERKMLGVLLVCSPGVLLPLYEK